MLMVYNGTGSMNLKTGETILDPDLLSEYVGNIEQYPLKLDLALPLFSWGVVIREQKTVHLLEHLYSDQLEHTDKFKFINPEMLQVLQDCYLNGFYLKAGDIIRVEDVSMEHLFDAAELLAPLLPTDSLFISFYHLDTPTINRYAYKNLETICRIFD